MSEILMYYAVFALSGGIASTWALHRPSMYIVEEIRPTSIVLNHKLASSLFFCGFATVMAPVMLICLFYEEHFIDTFVDNLLKIDSKNTS